jgi:DNA repair protein RadC
LSSTDAEAVFRPLFEGLNHEECWVIFLTSSARIVDRMKISQGGVQATVVDNRLIFKRALELLATQIIIAHNHPSGSNEPSQADITLTNRIKAAAALFDINLIDHLIITATGAYSFKSHHLL